MKVNLQLALDFVDMHRALDVAELAVKGGVDWLEAGTPLIKSEGLNCVRELKKRYKDKTIVADMKTLDVGALEVEIAAKAGADIVSVSGLGDDDMIAESIRAGRKYGAEIMVDLLSVKDKPARAKEIEKLGADYLCVHVGIDEQMAGQDPLEVLGATAEEVSIPVGAAGGINSETAAGVVKAGASIIIVGGAITKAKDVKGAAELIRKGIEELESIPSELFKKYSRNELYKVLNMVTTPNISDAMHRKGAMKGIKTLIPKGQKIVGKAVTVRTLDGDWAKPVEAIDKAGEGDVIVIDVNGGATAVWGELASWSCKVKGVAGVVIDGAARDIDDIVESEFPTCARHFVPNAGEPKGYGEIGCEITCGGQRVRQGDWIVADQSGVVVIPKERAVEIANRALDVREKENRLRQEIKDGGTLAERMDLLRWEKIG